MSFYDVFTGLENTPLGEAIKESTWLFPVIEAGHLLALAVLGGAVILLDLRLLGVGLKAYPVSTVEKGVRPWLIGAILALVATGVLIGFSETLKLWGKPAFWVKMAALAAAILFTFLVRNPYARKDPERGLAAAGIAILSLALWLTVGLAGRWIGFS
jgi:hypothetical protein